MKPGGLDLLSTEQVLTLYERLFGKLDRYLLCHESSNRGSAGPGSQLGRQARLCHSAGSREVWKTARTVICPDSGR